MVPLQLGATAIGVGNWDSVLNADTEHYSTLTTVYC
jgi:hypothetical protein